MVEIVKLFTDMFVREGVATVEGLLGVKPDVSYLDLVALEGENIEPPYALVRATCKADGMKGVAETATIIPAKLATVLASMMVGDEAEPRDEITEDELDAVKEIVNNILGAVNTALAADSVLPAMTFEISGAEIVKEKVDLSEFVRAWYYNFSINGVDSHIINLASVEFVQFFHDKFSKEEPQEEAKTSLPQIPQEEFANIAMLLDVKLNVHVRIGQKKMLLKDVIAMDIGSVIELNQLANEPLEVLVDDKVIAHGEVVIVDGNFGVQITEIGSKKERLEQIKV
ncbi:flagellar motor switch protein FliY [Helicobacter brantae]|uniref:Flagellar motor switch protein FliN n=1 Tax=Helicobacter brantae TaxID=375927 RepID=A0A3D8J030_9HELI|nr:flagellar motor switch protein FliY [Helicobacter brantae]RDU70576.1 flagellar motor switch protein FliY [Helicobacter brantae]